MVVTCRSPYRSVRALSVFAIAGSVACSGGDKPGHTSSSAASSNEPAVMSADSMAAMYSAHRMASMTGDADRDFLRMMSDHEAGLVVLARTAQARKDGAIIPDATTLIAKHNEVLNRLTMLLAKNYSEAFAPKAMPADHAMADALGTKSGKEYERLFYQNVIQHQRDALTIIDTYLPKAKNASIKQMAETMKADRAREIEELQAKSAALGT